jgi:hypothetical protein
VMDVLEMALGVRVVGAEPPWLQQLALDHVLRLAEEMRRRTLPTVVDRRLLTELLDACGASRCGPARRRSCSPPGCASRPAGATTCGGWCRRRCPRSTATRGGCSRGPSPSPRRGCAMRSLGWLSPAAPESCILRPLNLAGTTAQGGKGLLVVLEGTDFDSEIDSSARLGSREGVLRSIQSTECNDRATWAAEPRGYGRPRREGPAGGSVRD